MGVQPAMDKFSGSRSSAVWGAEVPAAGVQSRHARSGKCEKQFFDAGFAPILYEPRPRQDQVCDQARAAAPLTAVPKDHYQKSSSVYGNFGVFKNQAGETDYHRPQFRRTGKLKAEFYDDANVRIS